VHFGDVFGASGNLNMKGRRILLATGSWWDVLRSSKRVLEAIGTLLCLIAPLLVQATDWPQYRGPNTDGISPDLIATNWATSFVVWTNSSLTNGFSSFAVSQSRAFTLISRSNGSELLECCAAVDAATGANLWATPIGIAPWDPTAEAYGGSGERPYYLGDGPRTTPSVSDGLVFALSGSNNLVCMNAINGSVIWSNSLCDRWGASADPYYQNAASPRIDGNLIFVNLNTSTTSGTLAAFRTSDGRMEWSSQNENATHATPVIATIAGVRQVVFATKTGVVSLDRTTGAFLWKFVYPFSPISVAMGASPVVYSNIVYCTASYGRGAAAARVTLNNGTWTVTQMYYISGSFNHQSIWMTPVHYNGYIYALCGGNSTFLTPPLNCIELATGDLKWAVDGFGMGGLILVYTNLLMLTEDGQLVLADPNPGAYTERARFRAFEFTMNAPGKCWNSPAFSDGRIYARSTRGGICMDVSPAGGLALKLSPPQFLNRTQFQLFVGTANGTPLGTDRFSRISVLATNRVDAPAAGWPKLTNPLVLTPEGKAVLTNTISPVQSRQFYRASEPP
jgi:outer membrane protein assembly factor BamB